MEYVSDVAATLAEFRRVVKPGGLAHVIDSDWGLLAVEPLGAERLADSSTPRSTRTRRRTSAASSGGRCAPRAFAT